MCFLHKNMQNNYAPSRYRNVDPSCYSFGGLRAQFPKFPVKVRDMRLMQLLKPQTFNHLHQSNESRLQLWR